MPSPKTSLKDSCPPDSLHRQSEPADCRPGCRHQKPPWSIPHHHCPVLIISILKFGQPVADERKRELLQTPVIVLDNVTHFHEADVVFIDELLVLGVLEGVLRHCVHVVEPEELVLASSRTMARMIVIILTG